MFSVTLSCFKYTFWNKLINVCIIQYSFHDGYIIRYNARSRKRLNPTLFPRLSHAKPALSSRWDIMQRENDHAHASFHSYPGSPYAVSGKNARVIWT